MVQEMAITALSQSFNPWSPGGSFMVQEMARWVGGGTFSKKWPVPAKSVG